MKTKLYIITASTITIIIYSIYYTHFFINEKYILSSDPAVWGQFGDYIGGISNPLLSFLSIVLLVKSLTFQYEANRNLTSEIEKNEKNEKFRSFEVLFFNLIESQKDLFDSFKISLPKNGRKKETIFHRNKAVLEIEHAISSINKEGKGNIEISEFLEDIDKDDKIFGLLRAFYIIALIITEKLSNENGFSEKDRETHFKALINLTDFSQLRLVMMSIQFLEYESSKFLRSSHELEKVILNLGLSYKLY